MFRFVQFLPNQFVRETKDKGSEVLELRNWEACDISRVWGWILFGFLMFLTVLWPNGQPTERIIGLSRLALAGQNVICGFLGQSSCQESYEYAKTAATTSSRAEIQVTLAWYNQRVAYRISFIAYRHNSHSTLRKVQGIPRMRKHFWVSGQHCCRRGKSVTQATCNVIVVASHSRCISWIGGIEASKASRHRQLTQHAKEIITSRNSRQRQLCHTYLICSINKSYL